MTPDPAGAITIQRIALLEAFAAHGLDDDMAPGDLVQIKPALRPALRGYHGQPMILWRWLPLQEHRPDPVTGGTVNCVVVHTDGDLMRFLRLDASFLQHIPEAERAPLFEALAAQSAGLEVPA